MRKLLTAFCACLLLLSCTVTAFAAEAENTTVDVKAQYVDNTPWNAVLPGDDGTASVTLSDGTSLTVSGIQNTDRQLVVEPVTEKEPLDWLNSLLNSKLNDRTVLHIFFLDENGTAHSADGITVTVTTAKTLTDAAVYSVSSDGNANSCAGVLGDNRLTFTTDGNAFYAYGSKLTSKPDTPDDPNTPDTPDDPNTPDTPDTPDDPNTPDTPDTPDNPNTPDTPDEPNTPNTPDTPGSPQTGNNSQLDLWLALLTVSGTTLLVVTVIGAKKASGQIVNK